MKPIKVTILLNYVGDHDEDDWDALTYDIKDHFHEVQENYEIERITVEDD